MTCVLFSICFSIIKIIFLNENTTTTKCASSILLNVEEVFDYEYKMNIEKIAYKYSGLTGMRFLN